MGKVYEIQFTQTEAEMAFKHERMVNLMRSKANSNLSKYFSLIRVVKVQKLEHVLSIRLW